jgi:hypothetical protein
MNGCSGCSKIVEHRVEHWLTWVLPVLPFRGAPEHHSPAPPDGEAQVCSGAPERST